MSMIDKVRAEMVAAMKNKEKERRESLSMLLSALKNKAIDKRADLTEEEEYAVVKKEMKQTRRRLIWLRQTEQISSSSAGRVWLFFPSLRPRR